MATYLDKGSQEVDSKTTVPDQTTPKKVFQDGELYASTLAMLQVNMSKKYEQEVTNQSSETENACKSAQAIEQGTERGLKEYKKEVLKNTKTSGTPQSASQTSNGGRPAESWFSFDIEEEQQKAIDKNKVKQKKAKDSTNKAENPGGKEAIFVAAKNVTKVEHGAVELQLSQEDQMKGMAEAMLARLNREIVDLGKYYALYSSYKKDPSYTNLVKLVQYVQSKCPKGSFKYKELSFLLMCAMGDKNTDDHWYDGLAGFGHWLTGDKPHAIKDLEATSLMALALPEAVFKSGLFPDVGADAAALLDSVGEAEFKALIEGLLDFIREIQQLLGLMEAGKGKNELVKVAGFMSAVQEAGTRFQLNKNKNQKDLNTVLMQEQERKVEATEKKIKDAAAAKARAGIFSFLIDFVSVIIMAVCACFGQFEVVAIMVVTMTLEKTGVIAKLTAAIAKAIGSEVGADVIVGAMELVLTLGAAGVGIARQAAEVAAEAAAAIAAEAAAEVGVELAKEAIETGAKTAVQAAVQAAAQTGTNGLQGAMEVVSSLATGWSKSITQRVAESLEQLAKIAIKKLGTKGAVAAAKAGLQEMEAAGEQIAKAGAESIEKAAFSKKLLLKVIEIAAKEGETIAAPAAKAAAKSAETGFANAIEEAIGNVNLISKVRIIVEIGKETAEGLTKLATASFEYGITGLKDATGDALKVIESSASKIDSAVEQAMTDLEKLMVQNVVTATAGTAANVGGNAVSQGTASGASTGAEATATGVTQGIELQEVIVRETDSVVGITKAAAETAVKKGATEAAEGTEVTTEKLMTQGKEVAEADAKQVAEAQVKKQIRQQIKSALYLGIGNGLSSTNFAADVAKAIDPNGSDFLKMLIEIAIEITTVILTMKGGLGSAGAGETADLTKSVKSGLKSMMDLSEETMSKMAMAGQYAQAGGIATESGFQVGSGISQIQIGMAQQAIAQIQAEMILLNEASKMMDTETKEDMEHLKQMLKSQEADMSAAINNPGVIGEAIVQALNA